MRNLLVVAIFCLGASGLAFAHESKHEHEKKAPNAEPIEQTEAGKVYGAKLPKDMPNAIEIGEAADNAADHMDKLGAFSGRITEVCQNSGCWVVLTGSNGQLARVTMHDHAFGVPKDSSGPAVVYGTFGKSVKSAGEVDHLKSEGANNVQAEELKIDALSVLIPTAK